MHSSSGYGNGYHHQHQQHADKHFGPSLRDRARRGTRRGSGARSRDSRDGHGPSGGATVGLRVCEQQRPPTDFDMAYFHSYAHVGIHEEMIKDRVRTETYRAAIMQHQSSIAGKVVVDVGCGTGILSIFCAQAGAKRVYAVDASEIAVQANEVVKANNLSDIVIVLHGRVEDVQIDEEVDVIISEWMGYMLLYESMLGSVITARDRWLKPGGLILPSNATLYMAPITHSDRYSESIDFWRNVYGIDMSAMLPLAKQCAFEEPCVETITGENVLTWPHVVKHLDCYTISIHELETVTTRYKFKSMMRGNLYPLLAHNSIYIFSGLLSPFTRCFFDLIFPRFVISRAKNRWVRCGFGAEPTSAMRGKNMPKLVDWGRENRYYRSRCGAVRFVSSVCRRHLCDGGGMPSTFTMREQKKVVGEMETEEGRRREEEEEKEEGPVGL